MGPPQKGCYKVKKVTCNDILRHVKINQKSDPEFISRLNTV